MTRGGAQMTLAARMAYLWGCSWPPDRKRFRDTLHSMAAFLKGLHRVNKPPKTDGDWRGGAGIGPVGQWKYVPDAHFYTCASESLAGFAMCMRVIASYWLVHK